MGAKHITQADHFYNQPIQATPGNSSEHSRIPISIHCNETGLRTIGTGRSKQEANKVTN